jgi:hypothetical protein
LSSLPVAAGKGKTEGVMDLETSSKIGKKLGLAGDTLKTFIESQQALARDFHLAKGNAEKEREQAFAAVRLRERELEKERKQDILFGN